MTSAIFILRIFRKKFDHFSNFSGTFRSFRSFEIVSSNILRRCDLFGPKIVKIRAILAIFQSFEDFHFLSVHHLFHILKYWELPLAFEFDSNCKVLGGLAVQIIFKCFVFTPSSICFHFVCIVLPCAAWFKDWLFYHAACLEVRKEWPLPMHVTVRSSFSSWSHLGGHLHTNISTLDTKANRHPWTSTSRV